MWLPHMFARSIALGMHQVDNADILSGDSTIVSGYEALENPRSCPVLFCVLLSASTISHIANLDSNTLFDRAADP